MRTIGRNALGILTPLMMLGAVPGVAQQAGPEDPELLRSYFGVVADYFRLPETEVSILGDWHLPADEIPVVLFLARRAGVSPEAIVVLRRRGRSWHELAARYGVDAAAFHVPVEKGADLGPLADAFARYHALPTRQWSRIELSDSEIIGLVNVRVLSQMLDIPPGRILAAVGGGSYVAAYGRLIRGAR